jgi:hypothetical protein
MLLAAVHGASNQETLLSSRAGIAGFALLFALELITLRHLGDRVQGRLLWWIESGRAPKLFVYPLMAPGVALHELGHAVASIVSGAGLRKVVLFWPRRQDDGRFTLGYVQPRYVPRLPGGGILISCAPLVFPPLALYGLAVLLVPGLHGLEAPQHVFAAAGSHLTTPSVLLWLFLFCSMVLSNFPSDVDFQVLGRGGQLGLLLLIAGPFVLAAASPAAGPSALGPELLLALFLAPSLAVAAVVALLFEGGARRLG